jgi:multisubunit Na+/H+ antiporter MnhF subunit
MAELHPAASHHLPSFITAPGETDVLMVVTAVILALAVLGFGLLFLRLHSLPERMAHGSHRLQFEIVAVLCLLALFTHIHLFWVAALLLALIEIPDFGGWLGRIAGAVEKIAGLKPGEGATLEAPPETIVGAKQAEAAAAAPPDTVSRPAKRSEAAHA